MMKITDVMRRMLEVALADGVPCLVGTAAKDGHPQISPKGSVAVFDDQTLSYWERSNRSSLHHLRENPRVVIYYRNPARAAEMPFPGAAVRFHGTARLVADGPERERAWELTVPLEQQRDPEKKGSAVLVRVDLIEELSGKVVMKQD
jgi:predicted pyridoxine 5'-phosphate oxidase superfamily flavin-nucleotide-binding protein